MYDFLNYIVEEVPWLRTGLAWVIVVLCAVLVLAPVAYFLLWPLFERLHDQLSKYVNSLKKRLEEGRDHRKKSLEEAGKEFLKDGGLIRYYNGLAVEWSVELHQSVRALKRLRRPLNRAVRYLKAAVEHVPSLVERLEQTSVVEAQSFPPMGTAESVADSCAERRVSWFHALLTSVILAAVVFINTFFLSQILKDMGLVPPAMIVLGVPLANVVALFFTALEAGLGVIHAVTSRKEPSARRSLVLVSVVVLIFIISFAEGFFWSRIVSASNTFRLPLVGYELPQSDILYGVGFVFTWMIFLLGKSVVDSFNQALTSNKHQLLVRVLDKLRKKYNGYKAAIEKSAGALSDAKLVSSNLEAQLSGNAARAESFRNLVEQAMEEAKKLQGATSVWIERPLTSIEVFDLSQKGGLWFVCSTVIAVVLGIVSFESVSRLHEPALRWALAIAPVVVFFGVGVLLNSGESLIVKGSDCQMRVVTPLHTRLAGLLLGSILVVFYVALAFSSTRGATWFINLIIGLFLVAAGYQMTPLMNVLRLWLKRVCSLVALLGQVIWITVAVVVSFVVSILENLFFMFASPVDRLLNRKEKARSSKAGIRVGKTVGEVSEQGR